MYHQCAPRDVVCSTTADGNAAKMNVHVCHTFGVGRQGVHVAGMMRAWIPNGALYVDFSLRLAWIVDDLDCNHPVRLLTEGFVGDSPLCAVISAMYISDPDRQEGLRGARFKVGRQW